MTVSTKGKYALETAVAPEKTQRDIHALLDKYKVSDFNLLIAKRTLGVAFQLQQRTIRFVLPLP